MMLGHLTFQNFNQTCSRGSGVADKAEVRPPLITLLGPSEEQRGIHPNIPSPLSLLSGSRTGFTFVSVGQKTTQTFEFSHV